MAVVGLKILRMALVDPTTQLLLKGDEGLSDDGLYEVDDAALGTKTANITGLEGNTTKVSGNNKVQDAYQGPAAPVIASTFNNLPFPIRQKILGNQPDGKGGYLYQGWKPHVAVSIETQTLDRKDSVFFNFGNTIASLPGQNLGTDTDQAQTRQDDNPSFTALGSNAYNGQPKKEYYTGDEDFDMANMYKETFGGYVLNEADSGQETAPKSAAPANDSSAAGTNGVTPTSSDAASSAAPAGSTAAEDPTEAAGAGSPSSDASTD